MQRALLAPEILVRSVDLRDLKWCQVSWCVVATDGTAKATLWRGLCHGEQPCPVPQLLSRAPARVLAIALGLWWFPWSHHHRLGIVQGINRLHYQRFEPCMYR